jgi:hypothetical protein
VKDVIRYDKADVAGCMRLDGCCCGSGDGGGGAEERVQYSSKRSFCNQAKNQRDRRFAGICCALRRKMGQNLCLAGCTTPARMLCCLQRQPGCNLTTPFLQPHSPPPHHSGQGTALHTSQLLLWYAAGRDRWSPAHPHAQPMAAAVL